MKQQVDISFWLIPNGNRKLSDWHLCSPDTIAYVSTCNRYIFYISVHSHSQLAFDISVHKITNWSNSKRTRATFEGMIECGTIIWIIYKQILWLILFIQQIHEIRPILSWGTQHWAPTSNTTSPKNDKFCAPEQRTNLSNGWKKCVHPSTLTTPTNN